MRQACGEVVVLIREISAGCSGMPVQSVFVG
jgi:hypothetical protein